MANLNESATWPAGIYQLETTDPVVGGADGISNLQAKQLANRTAYLKTRADEVDTARGGYASLGERLIAVENQAEVGGPDNQRGEITLINRGIARGCSVSKSTSAARNLNLAAGACFAKGRVFSVAAGVNAASVPSNIGTSAAVVYAYLHQDASGLWRLAVTPIGVAVPDGGIVIYTLTIPAASTDESDPNLASVALTDVRRLEVTFPQIADGPATASALLTPLASNDYMLTFDVVSATGAPCTADSIVVSSRATNGFTIQLASAADNVVIRWRASKLN